MPMFNKSKLASLSPTSPPKGFIGKGKKPMMVDDKKKKKPLSGFMSVFGKK